MGNLEMPGVDMRKPDITNYPGEALCSKARLGQDQISWISRSFETHIPANHRQQVKVSTLPEEGHGSNLDARPISQRFPKEGFARKSSRLPGSAGKSAPGLIGSAFRRRISVRLRKRRGKMRRRKRERKLYTRSKVDLDIGIVDRSRTE